MTPEVRAANWSDLIAIAEERWGSPPPRLERRGKQHLLEGYVMLLFLKANARKFAYPISINQRDRPDFVLNDQIGKNFIEVTEAVDPEEQKLWTSREKDAQDTEPTKVDEIDLDDPTRKRRFSELVGQAIRRKSQVDYRIDTLLIYPNTYANSFETPEWELDALEITDLKDVTFNAIWIVASDHGIELIRNQVVRFVSA